MKCCENSTTTLDGAFISCCLQEEVIAKDEVIENLEKENARLKVQIESPCTSCCITETLEQSLDEMNYQVVNQDAEIRQLKEQIEKMKWHDLRKDPNDLPKECQNVLCLCNDIGCKYYCTGHLIYKTWFSNTESKVLRVTAWCELPKF